MGLIENIINEKGAELTESLIVAGVRIEQTQAFLPDALRSVLGSVQKVDVQALLVAGRHAQMSSLMSKVDINTLSGRLDGDTELAINSVQILIPQVIGFLKENRAATGLLGMLGARDTSGLAGLAKRSFS